MNADKFMMQLAGKMVSAANNTYKDNYDDYRFGKLPEEKRQRSLKHAVISFLNKKGYYHNNNNLELGKRIENINYPLTYLTDRAIQAVQKLYLLMIIVTCVNCTKLIL